MGSAEATKPRIIPEQPLQREIAGSRRPERLPAAPGSDAQADPARATRRIRWPRIQEKPNVSYVKVSIDTKWPDEDN